MVNPIHLQRSPRFEQFSAARLYQLTLSLSPDGEQVAYSINTSGQFNLWVQFVRGGTPRQLTFFDDQAVRAVSWSPDGKYLVFQADRDGNECFQIYALPQSGGWPELLTHQPEARYILGGWSRDGHWLTYTTNERERSQMDIVGLDWATGETQRFLSGGLFFFAGWSPDNKRFLAMQMLNNSDNNVYLIEPGVDPILLTPHQGQALYLPVRWVPDGTGFYFVTDYGREFKGLAFYHLSKNAWEWVETPEWDIEMALLSKDGKRLVWSVDEDGYSVFHARNLVSGEIINLPEIPKGVILMPTISDDGQRVAFFLSRPVSSTEIFVLDLESKQLYQITDNDLGGLDRSKLVEPDLVHIESLDGLQIPAFLYRPSHRSGEKVPLVVCLHGGPQEQERPRYMYMGMYQYLLSRGIGVLAPNIRGSVGYGKSFQKRIYRDWGGGDLNDVEALVQYLHSLDWIDSQRIGIFGGSYGGFVTLSCITRLPQYWRAAVEWFGPSNLITFTSTVPPWWRRMIAVMVGDPDKDREFLLERSPITYSEKIAVPLLVVQGANDPRVAKAESDQLVEKLRAMGQIVRYDVYENEGHGFTRRENEMKAFRNAAEWFEKYLLIG